MSVTVQDIHFLLILSVIVVCLAVISLLLNILCPRFIDTVMYKLGAFGDTDVLFNTVQAAQKSDSTIYIITEELKK